MAEGDVRARTLVVTSIRRATICSVTRRYFGSVVQNLVTEQRHSTPCNQRLTDAKGTLAAALSRRSTLSRLESTTLLPGTAGERRGRALAQAEVEINQATVFAGTDGTVKQFKLRVG